MEFARMGVEVIDKGEPAHLSNLVVGLGLLVAQLENPEGTEIR